MLILTRVRRLTLIFDVLFDKNMFKKIQKIKIGDKIV